MIIAIVSEMSRSKFQWSDAFNIDAQLKNNTIVFPLEFSKDRYLSLPKNDPYWDILRKADFVMVYATRINEPTPEWRWWELPRYVKTFMKPEAKMVCCIDDDWVPLFHPEWGWWSDYPYGSKTPDPAKFFKETGILDVPDMWLTVLEKTEFEQYTTKPVRYMPLPQLNRYRDEISASVSEYNNKGLEKMHGTAIGLMRHSSVTGTVQNTLTNVTDRLNTPVVYFSTEHGGVTPVKSQVPIDAYPYLSRGEYMRILREKCKVTIDDTENYKGWSRLVMESAINYIPCVSSNQCGKIIYPKLYADHNDYEKQIALANKLLTNPKFYAKMVEEGQANLQQLTDEAFVNSIMALVKELNAPCYECDVKKELFLATLKIFVPYERIPARPNEGNHVWDRVHEKALTQAEWDKYYSIFDEYMKDQKTYDRLFKEASDRKNKNSNSFYFEVK